MIRGNDRGAATVELALLMPFLMILLAGVVDIGDALSVRVQLQEAVQEGVAYAVRHPDSPGQTILRAEDASSGLTDPAPAVSVTCSGTGPSVVTVRAVHSHDLLMGMLLDEPMTMTAESSGDVLSATTCVSG